MLGRPANIKTTLAQRIVFDGRMSSVVQTTFSTNVGLMLDRRSRRWAGIKPTLP